MYRIMLVGQNSGKNDEIVEHLREKKLDVVFFLDLVEARKTFEKEHFDVLLIDGGIHIYEGYYTERVRRHLQKIPVILFSEKKLAVRSEYIEKINADCFLEEDFSLEELYTKLVELIFQYFGVKGSHYMKCGNILIYPKTKEAVIGVRKLKMAKKEFDLLCCLMENKGQVVSRDEILNIVWGIDYFGEDRVVDTHIKKIRKKLGPERVHIKTVFKVGYVLRN